METDVFQGRLRLHFHPDWPGVHHLKILGLLQVSSLHWKKRSCLIWPQAQRQHQGAPTDHEGAAQPGLVVVDSWVPDLTRGAKTLQPSGLDSTCSSGPTDTSPPGASVS
ncbi:uncharacterized protein LOC129039306 isoform X6 [Pongo pygmaeus]|uniref:uncharacterized protein LOC129039306 isoform X6 n=1 Tax=Pongo pygmaeus TaxID=9600 RepID=UPI00300C70A9